jgi:RNA polymerase sigma-70 factor (ECF subfamily)
VAILARLGLVPHLAAPADGRSDAGASDLAACGRARITALYAEHGARIHRFLRDLLGDAALAADGTQETFVRAYKKLPDLEESSSLAGLLPGPSSGRVASTPERSLLPWLFGIARNVSLELRKARSRAGKYLAPAPPLLDAPAFGSPETDYLGREALRIICAALEQLPEERRAMLLLRLDHGLSYDEIAVTMGCSLSKVKVEIFRAREVLRATMADYEEPPSGRRAR